MTTDNTALTGPRILFVEDDPQFLYVHERALRDAGCEVYVAQDYFSALRVLDSDSPLDVLLTDVVMPKGINGFALARMARMRRRDLKVMFITGFDLPQDEVLGPILRKPVSSDRLVQAVMALCKTDA